MLSLQDLLGQEQGSDAVNQISQKLGANPTTTANAIQLALPMILSGLAQNASNPQEAESLSNTLQKNHDGSILGNLGGYLNQPDTNEGLGILGHIFGQKQGAAAQQVSQNTGLDMGQVAQLLIMLAPIVMAYLGKKKQQENLDAGDLSEMLQGQQQQIQSSDNPMMDVISNFFDSDQDGSSMDDLASIAANYMQKGR